MLRSRFRLLLGNVWSRLRVSLLYKTCIWLTGWFKWSQSYKVLFCTWQVIGTSSVQRTSNWRQWPATSARSSLHMVRDWKQTQNSHRLCNCATRVKLDSSGNFVIAQPAWSECLFLLFISFSNRPTSVESMVQEIRKQFGQCQHDLENDDFWPNLVRGLIFCPFRFVDPDHHWAITSPTKCCRYG